MIDEARYFDAYAADGYYMSSPIKNGRLRAPTLRDELAGHSCPICYTPVERRGYCAKHEGSEAAKRRSAKPHKVKVVMVKAPPPPKLGRTGKPYRQRRTVEQRRERFIEAVRLFARETGRIPTQAEWRREKRLPAFSECYAVFESWGDLLEQALDVKVSRG